jgi:hypothetical protein
VLVSPTDAAERACLAAAQPPADGDHLAAAVRLDVARVCETVSRELAANAMRCASPAEWRAIARTLAHHDRPDARAAMDAAMMLARGDVSGAADALAAMRGAELRQWCETMRRVSL